MIKPSQTMEDMNKSKIKLLLTDEGQLLYSRNWPEIPSVQASIYKDQMLLNDFNNRMKILLRFPVPVINPDKASLSGPGEPVEGGKFYEIEADFKIHYGDDGKYSCEIL